MLNSLRREWNDFGGLFIIIALLIAIAIFALWLLVSTPQEQKQQWEFERRDVFVQQCLLSEKYTREECVILATCNG